VISVKKINEKNFEILIKPNSSLNGWQRFFFLSSIFILCGGIAIFYFVGATMIVPFAGIELSAVFLAFYLNFKWSEQKELVTLSLDHVVVEKGRKQKEYTWREFRTFTAFEINKIKKDEINLGFKSKGQAVLVGDFLNADDKQELQYEISKIINHLNELNPSL
jgi:uncharacterized membrane protein